jgi:hypothetical protein
MKANTGAGRCRMPAPESEKQIQQNHHLNSSKT